MFREDPISTRKPYTGRVKAFCEANSDLSFPNRRFDLHPIPILKSQLTPSQSVHPQPDHIIPMTDGHEIGLIGCHGMGMDGLFSVEQTERMGVFWFWEKEGPF